MSGVVEVSIGDEWYDVINARSLILGHSDLNACLFGVDNYAHYTPLFAKRGMPADCSRAIADEFEAAAIDPQVVHASWVLWSELQNVDWDEKAACRDERITESVRDGETETVVTKWLNNPLMEWVKEALQRDPESEIVHQNKVFRRRVLTRRDCLQGTEFPLVMTLMETLAKRFGGQSVRLVVWFV